MACTYTAPPTTDKDWVRLLTGDTDVPLNCRLSDEEIQALIDEEVAINGSGPWTKYCAAARALGLLVSGAAGGVFESGVIEKAVGRLRIRRGTDASALEAIASRIDELQERCAVLMTPRPRAFATVGPKHRRRAGGH